MELLVVVVPILLASKFGCEAYCSKCIGFQEDNAEAVQQNQSLTGHLLESVPGLTTPSQCFYRCVDDCRCMSFNFQVGPTSDGLLCEKNSVDAVSHPEAMEERSGFAYHGIKLAPQSKLVNEQCHADDCHNQCCSSSPCQNGGACREVCGKNKRLQCACTAGYTGELCQFKAKSCIDYLKHDKSSKAGNYSIQDKNGTIFSVFCDFHPPAKFAWTMIMSYTFANRLQFKHQDFMKDHPVAENSLNWDAFRLSKSRMLEIRSQSSHWRATCNYETDGLKFTDYARASFTQVDPMTFVCAGNCCRVLEYINIRGSQCSFCSTWVGQTDSHWDFTLASAYGERNGCQFKSAPGALSFEHSFGFYGYPNPGHRCSSGPSSTTQYWFGAGIK